ncbi:hypothetical protein ACFX13_028150 [Malus domestica]
MLSFHLSNYAVGPKIYLRSTSAEVFRCHDGSLTVAFSGSLSWTREARSNSSTPSLSAEPGRVVRRFTIPRRASEPEFLIYSLDLDTSSPPPLLHPRASNEFFLSFS